MNRAQRRKAGIMEPTRGGKDGLELRMAVKDDQVIIEFGVKVKWFGMNVANTKTFIKNVQDQLKILEALEAEGE